MMIWTYLMKRVCWINKKAKRTNESSYIQQILYRRSYYFNSKSLIKPTTLYFLHFSALFSIKRRMLTVTITIQQVFSNEGNNLFYFLKQQDYIQINFNVYIPFIDLLRYICECCWSHTKIFCLLNFNNNQTKFHLYSYRRKSSIKFYR